MIDLSEVRLNNYYLFGGKEVFQVNEKFFDAFLTGEKDHLEMVSPIPLDDEWLVTRFKFRKVKNIEYYKVVKGDKAFTFQLEIGDDGGIYIKSSYSKVKLQYVHELQNIFYFTCKKEIDQ